MSINSAKKPRGRPKVDSEAVNVRMSRDDLELLDLWIKGNGGGMSRPEAMRRILKLVAIRVPNK